MTYQKAVAEHMKEAPQELAEYVRGRLVSSDNWRNGDSPVFVCGFGWLDSVEGEGFWSFINTQRWQEAMATDFWKKHTAPTETPSERPKGVIGQWYTMTSDFYFRGLVLKEAGYTWQCQDVYHNGVPTIDRVVMGDDESYRLATPEEIEKAQAKGEAPSIEEQFKQALNVDFVRVDSYSDKIAQVYDSLKEKQLNKNADYGDSAFQDIMVGGHKVSAVDACVARMSDKLKRLNSTGLSVSDESFQDTLDDLVGYIVIFKILNNGNE